MYKFIFYSSYNLLSRTRTPDPEDSAVLTVVLAAFFHIFLILSIFDFFELNFLKMAFGDVTNKFYWTPFAIAFMAIIYRLFNSERRIKIIKRYEKKNYKMSIWRISALIALVVLPLLIGIQFLNAN